MCAIANGASGEPAHLAQQQQGACGTQPYHFLAALGLLLSAVDLGLRVDEGVLQLAQLFTQPRFLVPSG